jgi:hypothetical protein
MVEEYNDNKPRRQRGEPAVLHLLSSFRVTANAAQVIGFSKLFLNFLFYNLPVEDAFPITSYTGAAVGSLVMSITPLWGSSEQAEQATICDSIGDIPELKHLDLQFDVKKCIGLPENLISDVRVQFSLPSWVSNQLLPPDFHDKLQRKTEERTKRERRQSLTSKGQRDGSDDDFSDDEADLDDEDFGEDTLQRGGTYTSTWTADGNVVLTVNPAIDWRFVIRITSMSRKIKEWLKTAELSVSVLGAVPSAEQQALYDPNSDQAETNRLMGQMAQEQNEKVREEERAVVRQAEKEQEALLTELRKQLQEAKELIANKDAFVLQTTEQTAKQVEYAEKVKKVRVELEDAKKQARGAMKRKLVAVKDFQVKDRQAIAKLKQGEREVQARVRDATAKEREAVRKHKEAQAKGASVAKRLAQSKERAKAAVSGEEAEAYSERSVLRDLAAAKVRLAVLEKLKSKACIVS